MTLEECISEVRIFLDEPQFQKPSPHIIHVHLVANYQMIFNVVQNAQPNWQVRYFDLNVTAGTDKFLIPAQDFGKDVLIHTYDPTGAQFIERPIDRCDIQELPNRWRGPRHFAYVDTPSWPSAEIMCIYWQEGQPWVMIRPEPNGPATYRIWYETRVVDNLLASSPLLPVGHPYLNIMTAVSCLPHAEWQGFSFDQNTAKRGELQQSLTLREAGHADAFKKYLATAKQDGVIRKRPYLDDLGSGGFNSRTGGGGFW